MWAKRPRRAVAAKGTTMREKRATVRLTVAYGTRVRCAHKRSLTNYCHLCTDSVSLFPLGMREQDACYATDVPEPRGAVCRSYRRPPTRWGSWRADYGGERAQGRGWGMG